MIEKGLKTSEFAIMAKGVWVCFENEPSLETVKEARRLLDQLTDELIKESLDAIQRTEA
jgi:hypothetical protein